jgi:hypothetical protein
MDTPHAHTTILIRVCPGGWVRGVTHPVTAIGILDGGGRAGITHGACPTCAAALAAYVDHLETSTTRSAA